MAARAPREPLLDVDDMQGDSLAGFRKNHQFFLFFRITDVEGFRRWLAGLVDELATLREVLRFNELYRLARSRRGAHHTGLSALWMNIAFTHTGLRALTSDADVDAFDDAAFTIGLARRAALLGDLAADGGHDPTSGWRFGGTGGQVDGVLLIGADDPVALDRKASDVERAFTDVDHPATKVWAETCHVRPDLPGHEHFGFRDGISQPGIRGRVDDGRYLTPRFIDAADPRATRYARPGQRLVWPGEFVLGLPRQPLPPKDDLTPGSARVPGPRWSRNGSFVVIRRLAQDVTAFRDFLATANRALRVAGADLTDDHLAALLIGRWPSGAPLARAPKADNPALGADDFAANDFGYESAWLDAAFTEPPTLRADAILPGQVTPLDDYPPAAPDDPGRLCPHSAHLRKVNPRDQATDIGGPDNTLHRRILRRGIPFGPPYTDASADVERGLMFVAYQASIVDQFEFLTTDWVNSELNPRAHPGGMDLVIGGKPLAARNLVLSNENGDPFTIPVAAPGVRAWVTATGGGYFFAPALSSVADMLARTPQNHLPRGAKHPAPPTGRSG